MMDSDERNEAARMHPEGWGIPDKEEAPIEVHTVISVMDMPGPGGANHVYRISQVDADGNPTGPIGRFARIEFQNGPIGLAGVNGCTNEDLIGIVMHRLGAFQAGDYACEENAAALLALEHAMSFMVERTRKRMRQGVEGTYQPHREESDEEQIARLDGDNLSALAGAPVGPLQ